MGRADRVLRFALVAVFAVLIATGVVGGMWAWGLGGLSLAMLFSGTTGHCPIYRPFRFTTRRNDG